MKKKRLVRNLIIVIVFILIILLWEFVISNTENIELANSRIYELTGWKSNFESISETMLPRPSKILRTLLIVPINGRGGLAYFWRHTKTTLYGASLGFLFGNLLAMITATTFLFSKPLERGIMPIALALRSIPLVAISPLLLRIRFTLSSMDSITNNNLLSSLFGTDMFMKAVIVTILVYFPSLVNIARGLTSVSQPALELMHTLHASRWQVFWKMRVPTALPLTFAALKVAASSAILGVIVAEWLSSSEGLGYVIYRSYGESQIPRMMMAGILSSLIAVITFFAVDLIQKWAIPWNPQVSKVNSIDRGRKC